MKQIEIFTDGACRGNPGPGGWGAVLRYKNHERTIHGYAHYTTNNQMELTAVIEALKRLKQPCHIDITTDSKYVKNGITQWMARWKKNGWQTRDRKAVKNQQLWQQLDELLQQHQVEWHWIQGHSGHRENEIADQLARKAIELQG